ncbi:hypothetical protein [Nocardia sp. IFM 10818]
MGLLPSAVGYLRSDISRIAQPHDELRIRQAAKRTGYDLRKIIVFSANTDNPVHRLRVVIDRLGVDAVIVPSAVHFDERKVPAELLEVAAVVSVSPANIFPRQAPNVAHEGEGGR